MTPEKSKKGKRGRVLVIIAGLLVLGISATVALNWWRIYCDLFPERAIVGAWQVTDADAFSAKILIWQFTEDGELVFEDFPANFAEPGMISLIGDWDVETEPIEYSVEGRDVVYRVNWLGLSTEKRYRIEFESWTELVLREKGRVDHEIRFERIEIDELPTS